MHVLQSLQANPWLSLVVAAIKSGLHWCLFFLILYTAYHYLELHRRFGFFKTAQPRSHYLSMMKNWKVPLIWGAGYALASRMVGLNLDVGLGHAPQLSWSLPAAWQILPRHGLWTDLLYAAIGFYLVDLLDYLSHRFNHRVDYLYRNFPCGHFMHHNCVFLTPMSISSAPPVPLILVGTWGVYALLLSQGLVLSVLLVHLVRTLSGTIAHLGFDPAPWLSRLNHRVGGWIPWLPLHHQYHHVPVVQFGNYGNVTGLWDYVFGTTIPECIHHLEHRRAMPEVQRFFDNAEAEMAVYFKDRLGWNLPRPGASASLGSPPANALAAAGS